MNKKSLFIFLLIFSFSNLFSADFEQIVFKIQPLFGIINGSIEEAVYKSNSDGERIYYSRLDWDVKNIPYWGADIKATISKYVNFEFNLIQGISCISGNIQDYDWLSTDPEELTNYSCHTNTMNKFSKIRIGLSGNIFIGKYVILCPGLFINEEYFKFTGSDGYKTYQDENWEVKYFEGDVISYEQRTENILLSLSAIFGKYDKYYGLINFSIGPNTNIETYDYHINKDAIYNDKIYSCLYYESSVSGEFFFTQNFGFGGKFYIQYLPNSYGTTWYTSTKSTNWYKDNSCEGGTNRIFYYAQLNASLRF
ncbi:MAG: omptin family outer membrane protease [Treponema sp.]|nr:omptin family outer membrane protease [Treponema sp.]